MNDDLSQDARQLFASARASFSPDASRVAAVRAAVDARIAAPAASGSEAHASGGAGTAAGAAASPGIAGLGLVAGVLLAGGVALIAWRHQPAPAPAVQASTPPPALAVQAPAAAAAPVEVDRGGESPPTVNAEALPTAAPSSAQLPRSPIHAHPLSALAVQARREAPAATPPVENAPAQDDTLAREISLLRSARAALEVGDAERALALLGKHAQLWPGGVLTEERLATQVLALCALGRVAQARETAGQLESLAPASPHLARVRSSCARRTASGGP